MASEWMDGWMVINYSLGELDDGLTQADCLYLCHDISSGWVVKEYFLFLLQRIFKIGSSVSKFSRSVGYNILTSPSLVPNLGLKM